MRKTIRITLHLPAKAAAIYQALTDQSQLTMWLTEQAKVSLSEGVYELWGRYLLGAPETPATRFVEAAENRLLRFVWNLHGMDSLVLLELASAEDETQLTLSQEVRERAEGEASVADFWMLAFENLRRLVAGGSSPIFCDYTVPRLGQAIITADIKAPAETIFQALIDPAQLERYIATKATVEPQVGGKYDLGWSAGPIKILEIEPNRKLSYSWQYGDDPETIVTWTLEGSEGGTHLTLVHSGFAPDRAANDYTTGWFKFVNDLKSMVEIGPSWQKAIPNDADY